MVKLHLEFEDYKGDVVKRDENKCYKITRMLPPGSHRYFFTIKHEIKVRLDAVKQSSEVELTQPKIGKELLYLTKLSDLTQQPKEAKAVKVLTAAQLALIKAKLKAANVRNDDPEPEYLNIEIPFTNVIENIKQTS